MQMLTYDNVSKINIILAGTQETFSHSIKTLHITYDKWVQPQDNSHRLIIILLQNPEIPDLKFSYRNTKTLKTDIWDVNIHPTMGNIKP